MVHYDRIWPSDERLLHIQAHLRDLQVTRFKVLLEVQPFLLSFHFLLQLLLLFRRHRWGRWRQGQLVTALKSLEGLLECRVNNSLVRLIFIGR